MSLSEPVVCRSHVSLFFCQYILRFLISSIIMSDVMRERFYDLLSESVNKKKDNNFYFTSER